MSTAVDIAVGGVVFCVNSCECVYEDEGEGE